MSFSGDIEKFSKKAQLRAEQVVRGLGLALATDVILATPVDTGRLRGSWQIGIGAPDLTVTEGDDTGLAAIQRARARLAVAFLGKQVHISNNVHYAQVIEAGRIGNTGSFQAPQGMMRITVQKYIQRFPSLAKLIIQGAQ